MHVSCGSRHSIPQEWLDAFNKLRSADRPYFITKAKWLDIHYNTIILFKNETHILQTIILNGWTVNDIFGCHYLAPIIRFDCAGLLLLKNRQEEIVDVSRTRIRLTTKNGVRQSYYKVPANREQVLLYELVKN